jgi:hypothetical protein
MPTHSLESIVSPDPDRAQQLEHASRNTKDSFDSKLMKSTEQIVSDLDLTHDSCRGLIFVEGSSNDIGKYDDFERLSLVLGLQTSPRGALDRYLYAQCRATATDLEACSMTDRVVLKLRSIWDTTLRDGTRVLSELSNVDENRQEFTERTISNSN